MTSVTGSLWIVGGVLYAAAGCHLMLGREGLAMRFGLAAAVVLLAANLSLLGGPDDDGERDPVPDRPPDDGDALPLGPRLEPEVTASMARPREVTA